MREETSPKRSLEFTNTQLKDAMPMATIAVFLKIDAERVADSLQQASAKVTVAKGETVLDFSAVQRIDTKGLNAMEDLARLADVKSVSIGLRGVNVNIYKVLKLAKLTPRFCFLT
jgi:anti-anti-sigma regulatory factor